MPIEQNLETSGSLNSTSGVTSAVPLMPFSRGSEWRKWDLHVHTPASGMANGYGGDWDDYVKTLFTLAVEREVAAIGITDYFTIEGYEKIVNEYMGDDEYEKIAYQVARFHHEKWNGKGYPDGLSRKEIPLCARIMAVADVFDAVSAKRCYRDAMPLEQCFSIIEDGSGQDFDPYIADVFLDMKEIITKIVESN